MAKQTREPVKWVSSAKRDLDAVPEDVNVVFGHAIDLAQAGGKHQDAKVMTGFGSAGVNEHAGSTNVYADLVARLGLRRKDCGCPVRRRAGKIELQFACRHSDRAPDGIEPGLRKLALYSWRPNASSQSVAKQAALNHVLRTSIAGASTSRRSLTCSSCPSIARFWPKTCRTG